MELVAEFNGSASGSMTSLWMQIASFFNCSGGVAPSAAMPALYPTLTKKTSSPLDDLQLITDSSRF